MRSIFLFALNAVAIWHIYAVIFIRYLAGYFHRNAMSASISLALAFPERVCTLGHNTHSQLFATSSCIINGDSATFFIGRYVFQDGFQYSGWGSGKPKHKLAVFALTLFIFVVPFCLNLL